MKRAEASVSVFLAMTITMVLSFCMVLIESARERAMLLKADIVFDTSVNCIMAEYHRMLWEEYDLFYVDAGYGGTMPNYDLVKEHLAEYVEKNLKYDGSGWLSLGYEGAAMSEVCLATDNEGADFYTQAIAAAEAMSGVSYIEQILEWLGQVQENNIFSSGIESEKESLSGRIEDVNGTEVEVKEAVWGKDKEGKPIMLEEAEYEKVDIHNPLDDILPQNLLLMQIVEDAGQISKGSVNLEDLASNRSLAAGVSKERTRSENGVKSLWNKAFFCKYARDHFPSYGDEAVSTDWQPETVATATNNTSLTYELEYLIGGKESDRDNLEAVAARILAWREADNYLCLLNNEARQLEAHAIAAASANIAVWMEPVVYQALLLYWAYEDSIQDLKVLFSGGKIPLLKFVSLEEGNGIRLNYEEHLLILLLLQDMQTLTMRSIDLIELSVRENWRHFRMDGCISLATLEGCFRDIYHKRYYVKKQLKYN